MKIFNMKNIIVILALISSITLMSCEETIKLDLKQINPKVVIEGMITDQPNMQYVKLTRSANFYADGETPRITNGTVTVKDDQDNTYVFVHNPENKQGLDGVYFPETPFTGVVGRTYFLTVLVDDQKFEAQDKLNPVTNVDSVTFKLDEDEKKDPKKAGKYYSMLIYAKEPKPSVDYYLFKFYRNDTLVFDDESDVYFSDDANIAENIDGIEGASHFGIGDTASVQFYSLDHDAFIYYNDLANLLQNAGGIFGSPPANSRTNLTNGALGFFQVSAVSSASAVLKKK